MKTFIQELEKRGLLQVVDTPVDRYLEITEIVDRVSKMKDGGKALLFTHVEGSPYPLLINALGSYERIELGLGATPNKIGERISRLISIKRYSTLWGKVKAIPSLLSLALSFPMKLPRRFLGKSAPCQQVVEEPNLGTLPVLHCWPDDGGPFFTLPLVFTKDPDTGRQNVGMYRMQVYDSCTTGMHWHLHKDGREIFEAYRRRGEPMPVSVVLSCDPTLVYGAISPMPNFIDEMAFSGFLRKKPVPMVKCITNDIYVPRSAEFVLEGEIPLHEFREEGPFGDHTGYYSLQDLYPVFHIKKITRKKHPTYPATIVGQPPMEDCYLGKATERIFLPLLRMLVPEVVDMNLPLEGVFHNCAIVSIHKRFITHGAKTLNALWGSGQMMYTKMIILVDASVNPHNYEEVLHAIFQHGLEESSMILSQGPLDALDHASPLAFQGYRLGVDATTKFPMEYGVEVPYSVPIEEQPVRNNLGAICNHFPEVLRVGELPGFWNPILPLVVDKSLIQEPISQYFRKLLLWLQPFGWHIVIIVDSSVDTTNPSEVFWKLFNNIDPKCDMYRCDTGYVVLFDATKKGSVDEHPREWPEDIVMSEDIRTLVDSKWDSYGIT